MEQQNNGRVLPPEREQALLQMLQTQGGAPGEGIPPEQQEVATQQGAEMAQADIENGSADAPPGEEAPAEGQQPAQPQPQADPSMAVAAGMGFKSVEDMATAFKNLAAAYESQNKELTQMVALQRAAGDTEELDPSDPQYDLRKTVRDYLDPLVSDLKAQKRNKLVQDAWGKDAAEWDDLSDLDVDIRAFFQENPEAALQEDGLRRARDAARSKRYKPEKALLEDSEFILKAKGSKALRDAVIKDYLEEIAKNGEIPPGVGGGGSIPLTGKKAPPKTLKEAKERTAALLGFQ